VGVEDERPPGVLIHFLELALSCLCYGTASALQARGALSTRESDQIDLGLVSRLARNGIYLGGITLAALGFVIQVPAIRAVPLYVVQSVQATNLAITALVAIPILKVRIRAYDLVAIAGLSLGLLLLLTSVSPSEPQLIDSSFHLGLLASTIALGALGFAVGRVKGTAGGVSLGLIAGLEFGSVGVAIRILRADNISGVLADPAIYALVIAGICALLFYAAGLQRGSVTVITAALLVTQIGGSALIGVLALGDRARPGLGLLAAAGSILAVLGAVVLARFGQPVDAATSAGQQRTGR
jgi:hypothetical protein